MTPTAVTATALAEPGLPPAPDFPFEAYLARSRAADLSGIAWDDVPRHPVPPEAVRTLRHMQDTESHTIVYLRALLATRAIDDPEVAAFLACWIYEETFHGLALARFLQATGCPLGPRPRPRGSEPLAKRLEAVATALVSRVAGFLRGAHDVGAINELTTLTGYRQLSLRAGHPVPTDLPERITLDESRHFFFYYRQAERPLARRGAARIARLLVDRFWAPVGSGVQPLEEQTFLAGYLFSDADGRAAARKVDATIRRLPGFSSARLLEAWMDRFVEPRGGAKGKRHGNRDH